MYSAQHTAAVIFGPSGLFVEAMQVSWKSVKQGQCYKCDSQPQVNEQVNNCSIALFVRVNLKATVSNTWSYNESLSAVSLIFNNIIRVDCWNKCRRKMEDEQTCLHPQVRNYAVHQI